jgi:polyferredoxin
MTQFGSSFCRLFFGFSYGILSFELGILVITLLFGRIYCSVLCPLGIFQDILSIGKKKYTYQKKLWWIQYPIFAFIISLAIFGFLLPLVFLMPSANFFSFINHLQSMEWTGSLIAFGFIIIFLILVRWKGRIYCNTVCPVGTFLSIFAKFSLFKIQIDQEQCVSCKACEKVCKASCIDALNKKVDNENCVVCFNCIDACKKGLITFSTKKTTCQKEMPKIENVNYSKRNFLIGVGTVATGVVGGWATGKFLPKQTDTLKPIKAILPPGAGTFEDFNKKCIGCGLCINACTNHVLEHAYTQYGWRGFMQPVMNYKKSYCLHHCNECMNICPVGALEKMTLEEKQKLQLGKRIFKVQECIAFKNNDCGKCAEICPTGALVMVQRGNKTLPKYDSTKCTGCGACEFICPVHVITIEPK